MVAAFTTQDTAFGRMIVFSRSREAKIEIEIEIKLITQPILYVWIVIMHTLTSLSWCVVWHELFTTHQAVVRI